MGERVSCDCRDAVAGKTEQEDCGQTAERVRVDTVNMVVVQQYDGQVAETGEGVGVDDRQLVVAQIKHLRVGVKQLNDGSEV